MWDTGYLCLYDECDSLHSKESLRDWILLVCFSWRYEATEGPRVNFVMHEALFEIYTWILCRFIPLWETLSRIQSLYLYFIKIVPFWLRNIRFFNTKHLVIILRASLFVITPSHVASWKIECQIFSYVYRSRKHWECKYLNMNWINIIKNCLQNICTLP